VTWDPTTRQISFGGEQLVWPRGFSAWEVDGHVQIVNPEGLVVAHNGSVLSGLGGTDGHLCFISGPVYGPAS
jgi:hypothetical protein